MTLISPILPVLAVLILNKVNQAVPLLVVSIIIAVYVLFASFNLIRVKKKAFGVKTLGLTLTLLGLIITLLIIFVTGSMIPKI